MKVIVTVLFLLGLSIGNLALPAQEKPITDDVELLPPESTGPFGGEPIVDTGIIGFGGGFSNPFSNPFGGLFENIENIMTRMRQQMETLLRHFNSTSNATSVDFPDITAGGFISPFGEPDLSKGNTTSVTKIIDGHKVVINETEYKKEDDFGGAYFKVRVVDVKPNDDDEIGTTSKDVETVTERQSTIRDRESVENSEENEIPKETSNYGNLELFDETDFGNFASNSLEYRPPGVDLSRDTYVNKILEESGATQNPDAEVFDVETFPGANRFQRYGFLRR